MKGVRMGCDEVLQRVRLGGRKANERRLHADLGEGVTASRASAKPQGCASETG